MVLKLTALTQVTTQAFQSAMQAMSMAMALMTSLLGLIVPTPMVKMLLARAMLSLVK
jgi:hypothetical protein